MAGGGEKAAMPELEAQEDGRLADNILHFARALRAAGLRVGPSRAVEAVRAVSAAGFERKADFYWVLHACFVARAEDRAVFDAAFKLFWRDPGFLDKMMSMLLRQAPGQDQEREKKAAENRAQQALIEGAEAPPRPEDPDGEEIEFDASLTFSADEQLRAMDFEQMSAAETAAAERAIAALRLPVRPLVSRRMRPAAGGSRADGRGTMRAALRRGGEIAEIKRAARRQRWPNLVALCDISGSMSAYSRMLLHFLHAASAKHGAGWAEVHSFTFGTRLTNVTRHLRARDVDEALAAAGAEAQDWEGGTRIGDSLAAFNRLWSRRVLGQGAVVLLITDGLDRGDPAALAAEADRLRLSCAKLIWLNPLLRWDGFAPKAQGVRALLPRVDSFRAAHNIASLDGLAAALTRADDAGDKARLMALLGAP